MVHFLIQQFCSPIHCFKWKSKLIIGLSVIVAVESKLLKARMRMQQKYLDQFYMLYDDFNITKLPLLPEEVKSQCPDFLHFKFMKSVLTIYNLVIYVFFMSKSNTIIASCFL